MKNKTAIIIGALVSILLLFFFGFLQNGDAKFLSLPSQWIIVAIIPILVALWVGGYITKFEGFGVKIETDLKASVITTVELRAADALAEIPHGEKESNAHLQKMSIKKALSIKCLVFEIGRSNYYSLFDILKYLRKMSNLDFFEVRTRKGGFVCFIPVRYFRHRSDNNSRQRGDFDNEKLNRFIGALEAGNILEQFANVAVSTTVKSDDSLVQVLKTLRDEQVDFVAVISKSDRYIGILLRSDVEKRVIDVVLSSQSA